MPSTRALGTVSCMRFRQRRIVDFPQPDGPMIAVTASWGIATETSFTAGVSPKNAVRFLVTMQGCFSVPADSRASATGARGAVI